MLNVPVLFDIGGGAMLNVEYGLLCCCWGGGAIEKFDKPPEVLDVEVLPHGFEGAEDADA